MRWPTYWPCSLLALLLVSLEAQQWSRHDYISAVVAGASSGWSARRKLEARCVLYSNMCSTSNKMLGLQGKGRAICGITGTQITCDMVSNTSPSELLMANFVISPAFPLDEVGSDFGIAQGG